MSQRIREIMAGLGDVGSFDGVPKDDSYSRGCYMQTGKVHFNSPKRVYMDNDKTEHENFEEICLAG